MNILIIIFNLGALAVWIKLFDFISAKFCANIKIQRYRNAVEPLL